jgi:hypothetical protein
MPDRQLEEVAGQFYGGQCEIDGKVYCTGCQMKINVVEGAHD